MRPPAPLVSLWQATFGRSQLLRFALVGGVGFIVDAGTLTSLVAWTGLGLYWGRVVSFVTAASATWFLNRLITFHAQAGSNRLREWASFVIVSIGGAALNYGTYALTLELWPLARQWPALGVAFGSIVGMGFNFPASKYLVFRGDRA